MRPAWEPADAAHFTGTARLLRLEDLRQAPTVKVFRVEFTARARTHWHVHSGPQILIVLEGRCRVGREEERRSPTVTELGPGEVMAITPGQRHWHGAAPGGAMTHIAVNIQSETRWEEAVSEAEYGEGVREKGDSSPG